MNQKQNKIVLIKRKKERNQRKKLLDGTNYGIIDVDELGKFNHHTGKN